LQIIRADWLSGLSQSRPNLCINYCGGIIKWQGRELSEELLLNLKAFSWIVATPRTVKQFAFDDRTDEHLCYWGRIQSLLQQRRFTIEVDDADIGIEQVSHN
jgi:hypothetical protein